MGHVLSGSSENPNFHPDPIIHQLEELGETKHLALICDIGICSICTTTTMG